MLPSEVNDLIDRYVPSMRHLETLILMHSEERRDWTVDDFTDRVGADAPQCGLVLVDLERLGLARREERDGSVAFHYAPADAATRRGVELLISMYHRQPVTLIRAIYERQSSAQRFADAFRLRNDEPKEPRNG